MDADRVEDPLGAAGALAFPVTAGNRVEPPVDEHAEAGFAPPRHAGIVLRGRLVERRRDPRREIRRPPLGVRRKRGRGSGEEKRRQEGREHEGRLRETGNRVEARFEIRPV